MADVISHYIKNNVFLSIHLLENQVNHLNYPIISLKLILGEQENYNQCIYLIGGKTCSHLCLI